MSSDLKGADAVISAQRVTKHFRLYRRPEDRLKQMVMPKFLRGGAAYFEGFEALKGVTLDIHRGETVGIIGRNGAGKSTLLQIICGTLQATAGELNVNGRIAALLELGAGFNPDFTGRENVYMNGTIIGLTRAEIDARFDDIASFADIGPFMDQAAKTYSSGMYVRLAFAVAIHSDPQILVVDEALSVGDEAFQRKCYARLAQLQAGGATILFVSHSAQAVIELCDRAILLDGGEVLLTGTPKRVVGQYQRLMNLTGEAAETARASIMRMNAQEAQDGKGEVKAPAPIKQGTTSDAGKKNGPGSALDPSWHDSALLSQSVVSYENRGAEILDVQVHNSRGEQVNNLAIGRSYRLSYNVKFHEDAANLHYGFMLKTVSGIELGGSNNVRVDQPQISSAKAGETVTVSFDFTCNLMAGTYFVTTGLMALKDGDHVFLHRTVDAIALRVMQGTNPSPFDAGHISLGSKLSTKITQ